MIPFSQHPERRLPDPHGRPVLLLDADRTLTPSDTGRLVAALLGGDLSHRIRAHFEAHGYTTDAFRAHARLWSEVPATAYDRACERVAEDVHLHPIWAQVLEAPRDLHVVVITAGLRNVWSRVLERVGAGHVPLLGGSHADFDRWCLSPACKAWVVESYRARGHVVGAVGDSLVDLPMLRAADHAALVADAKGSRPLREAFVREIPWGRHLPTDERRFDDVPATTLAQFLANLTTTTPESRHAPR